MATHIKTNEEIRLIEMPVVVAGYLIVVLNLMVMIRTFNFVVLDDLAGEIENKTQVNSRNLVLKC